MVSFTYYYVGMLVMLLSFLVVATQDVTHDLPYALAFYFQDTTLPLTTCQAELANVTNAAYPIYSLYLVVESNLEQSDLTTLEQSYADNAIRKQRQLLRRGEESPKKQRQLQSYCYTYCKTMPPAWLIAHGCQDECARRRLQLDDVAVNAESNDNQEQQEQVVTTNDHHSNDHRMMTLQSLGSILTSEYYQLVGNATNLLDGQGQDSAAAFYAAAGVLINATNPCRNIILNMTYQRVPLITNV